MCSVWELSLNTAKRPLHTQPVLLRYRENLSFQDLFHKFSLNFSHLTSYMCFVWALSLNNTNFKSIVNTSNMSKVLKRENLSRMNFKISHFITICHFGFTACRRRNYLFTGLRFSIKATSTFPLENY